MTDEIAATWSDTLANLLAADPATAFPQSSYVSWTANTYKNTRLWAMAVYFHIPSGTTVNSDGFV